MKILSILLDFYAGMYIIYIYMAPNRFRTKLIHIFLHEDEDKFLKEYAAKNYLSISELVRGWMHEVMKREGYEIKEPSVPETKSKKER